MCSDLLHVYQSVVTVMYYPLSYREEEMRAQGLDPAQFRDSSSVEERTLRLDLLGITHSEAETTTRGEHISRESSRSGRSGQQTNGTSEAVGLGGGKSAGLDVCGVGDKDKDAPSSTPLPPPLGVPIVTHSKGRKEGKCMYTIVYVLHLSFSPAVVRSLFDETAIKTRVCIQCMYIHITHVYLYLNTLSSA